MDEETLFDLKGEEALVVKAKDQNVFCIQAKWRSKRLANDLLSPDGKLQHLKKNISVVKENDILSRHFRCVMRALLDEKELSQKLQRFGLPLCDLYLETMIQMDLGVDESITDRHVIWAVLTALLCPLRQSVGSCFATAPAILVHEEQIGLFLEDLQTILATGQLKRIFGGDEYSVPISPSPGLGDLKKDYKAGNLPFEKTLEFIGIEKISKNRGKETFLDVLDASLLAHFDLRKQDFLKKDDPHFLKQLQLQQMNETMQKAKWHFVAYADSLLLKTWEFTFASFVDVKKEFSKWNLYNSLGMHPEEKEGIGELAYQHLEQQLEEINEKVAHFQMEYEITFDQVRATERLMRGISSNTEGRWLKAEHQTRMYHMRSCEEMRDRHHMHAQNIVNFFPFFIEQIIEKFQEYFQEAYDSEMHEVRGTPYDDSPAGFRLIYKHGRTHIGSWTFIRNKEEYIQSLKDFFLAIEHSVMDACEWEDGKREVSLLITKMVHHIEKEAFLVSAFYRLAKAHRVPLQKVSLDELETMEKKPWGYTSGGTMPTLLKTYFRIETTLFEQGRWVESPTDLLIFILETLKSLPPRIMNPFLKNPSKRMLMTSPTHAFSLLPGQHIFSQGWQDSGFTYTWVRDQIFIPRQEFYARVVLDRMEQRQFLHLLASRLPLLQGHEMEKNYPLHEKPLSLKKWRQGLVRYCPAPIIDSFLFETIPCKYPPLIFADTNWSFFYFAFLVNPGTGELELWRVDSSGKKGVPMYEWAQWLNGSTRQTWNIYPSIFYRLQQ